MSQEYDDIIFAHRWKLIWFMRCIGVGATNGISHTAVYFCLVWKYFRLAYGPQGSRVLDTYSLMSRSEVSPTPFFLEWTDLSSFKNELIGRTCRGSVGICVTAQIFSVEKEVLESLTNCQLLNLMANIPSLVSLKEVSSSCWLLPYLLCQYQQVMVVADGDSAELAPQIL